MLALRLDARREFAPHFVGELEAERDHHRAGHGIEPAGEAPSAGQG